MQRETEQSSQFMLGVLCSKLMVASRSVFFNSAIAVRFELSPIGHKW